MSTALSATQQLSSPPQEKPNSDWKRQLIECLDAYRAKHSETAPSIPRTSEITADSKASKIARRVAQRYADAPTYSELLAAAQAKQAAEDLLACQLEQDLLAAQEQIGQSQIEFSGAGTTMPDSLQPSPSTLTDELVSTESVSSAATQPGTPVMPRFAKRSQEMHLHQNVPEPEPTLEDLWASVLVEPRSVLPSKLIEFPRELVSSHRARPRAMQGESAESDAASQSEPTQLRIFEVSPESGSSDIAASMTKDIAADAQNTEDLLPSEPGIRNSAEIGSAKSMQGTESAINREPASTPVVTRPDRSGASSGNRQTIPSPRTSSSSASTARAYKNLEWAAISLDKDPVVARRKVETNVAEFVPFLVDPASIDRRVMAFAVDFAAVTAGFLAFLLVFAASTPHLPTGLPAIALGGAVYVSLWILYQMLFFSLSGSTAGMLYAHIALCTFDDQNPTRPALRRRLAAWWLSCLPLGIGFLWCFVDEDNLSWHDRITRMYQREY